MKKPIWEPSETRIEAAAMTDFMQVVNQQEGREIDNYQLLWRWSVDSSDKFWSLLWDYCGVNGDKGDKIVNDMEKMPGASWFSEAKINYAENLLENDAQGVALIFWGENKVKCSLSFDELRQEVSRTQQALRQAGVEAGDCVAGYLPNTVQTVVAMLATTSLGAVWCSASPDFGVDGVYDRFGQLHPKFIFCTDGYYYNGQWVDCLKKNHSLQRVMEDSCKFIVIPYDAYANTDLTKHSQWHTFLKPYQAIDIEYVRVAFGSALFIMFSSGTTGKPKCIVHSVGGTLLQHLKEHRLHCDIHPGDRLFYFTTCGWMMWNWLVTALASKATIVLYDGNPFADNKTVMFDLMEQLDITQFGTSAKFLQASEKFGLNPKKTHHFPSLRSIFSTGSPLLPSGFRFVYENIKQDVHLASISGGTDILSCFTLGNPCLPVYEGELQCIGLGMAVDAFDNNGNPTRETKGDLVCTKSFPSMPIGFFADVDRSEYHKAYFERFPGVWCHGDFIEITSRQSVVIYGRSDSVLNPGGVRIGTAEIYRQVEQVPQVLESVVVGQQWQGDVRVILFVVLQPGISLSNQLIEKIRTKIRKETTPRHRPEKVIQVNDIPKTKTGKIMELAVRDTIHGLEIDYINSLANPESLSYFKHLVLLEQ